MKKESQVEFYVEGRKIPNDKVMNYAYPFDNNPPSLEERIGDGSCMKCGHKSWVLFPRQLDDIKWMKPYITCRMCGNGTHL